MNRSSSFALVLLLSSSATVAACSSGGGGGYFPDAGAGAEAGKIVPSPDGGKKSAKDDGGPTDPDTDPDTTPEDGGVKKKGDAGPPPVLGDGSPPTTCAPGDVSTYVPQWKPPAAHSTVCTAQKVTDILTCIFDANANQTTCDAITNDPSNQPCADCLLTPSTSSTLGPVVIEGQIGSLNIAGCIALATGNTTASGCGAKYQAADSCANEACAANCPGTDNVALQELQQCQSQALANDCSTYATAADTCATPLLAPDGGAAICQSGLTFLDSAITLGKMFCAP